MQQGQVAEEPVHGLVQFWFPVYSQQDEDIPRQRQHTDGEEEKDQRHSQLWQVWEPTQG